MGQSRPEQPGIGASVGPLQHRREQAEGFPAPGARHPIAPERSTEAKDLRGPIRVAGRMLGSAPQIRLLGVQAGEPPALVRPGQVRSRRLGGIQKVLAMCRPDGGCLAVARLRESFGGELADGLQQPVAQGSPRWLRHDEAFVHERTEKAGDLECLDVTEAAHPFSGVQIEALGEHRQAPQQQLLGAVEQRIGPVDGRLQGLLPFQGGAASPGEQAKALVETVVKGTQ